MKLTAVIESLFHNKRIGSPQLMEAILRAKAIKDRY